MFELASRKKYRFPYKGLISVEDLWDLNVTQLDSVFMALNREVQNSEEESLLTTFAADADLIAKIEIVKYIFAVKQSEAEERANEAARAAKKQKILEILERKQNDSLQNMSEDELRKMLNEI